LLARLVLQVGERTVAMRLVMDHLRVGGLQAEIAAIALDARIVREVVRMARDAQVVVGLAEIPPVTSSSAWFSLLKPLFGITLKMP
jgi:hypothetical protein